LAWTGRGLTVGVALCCGLRGSGLRRAGASCYTFTYFIAISRIPSPRLALTLLPTGEAARRRPPGASGECEAPRPFPLWVCGSVRPLGWLMPPYAGKRRPNRRVWHVLPEPGVGGGAQGSRSEEAAGWLCYGRQGTRCVIVRPVLILSFDPPCTSVIFTYALPSDTH